MVHLRYLLVLIFTVITFSISVNSTTDGPCTCYTAGSTCGWSMQTGTCIPNALYNCVAVNTLPINFQACQCGCNNTDVGFGFQCNPC
ncbi:hypothetical protein RclHR1_05900012 [Rhizophagus clarus]|uniref:CBM1 domain-containing protein n=1 Tax=Rhizophagus clarus TaxID=94130 RepID=A0A2Z6S211_9GLOM|nr:hypothetical protein RclHR1_05900012 [Rhizophagus clarus]